MLQLLTVCCQNRVLIKWTVWICVTVMPNQVFANHLLTSPNLALHRFTHCHSLTLQMSCFVIIWIPLLLTDLWSFCFMSQFLSRPHSICPVHPVTSLSCILITAYVLIHPIRVYYIFALPYPHVLYLYLYALYIQSFSLYLHCYIYVHSSSICSNSLCSYLVITYPCGIHCAPKYLYLSIHSSQLVLRLSFAWWHILVFTIQYSVLQSRLSQLTHYSLTTHWFLQGLPSWFADMPISCLSI